MVRLLKLLAVVAGGGYLALLGLLFFGQRKLLFPAPVPRAPSGRVGELVRVEDAAGPLVLVHRKASPGRPTVLHLHGNAEQLADGEWLSWLLAERGLGYLGVEYPGYGLAGGAASEPGILGAADRAFAWLTGPGGVPVEQVAVLGQSLGSGPAVHLAAQGKARALVLLTPYTSIADAAQAALPFAPASLLVRDRFDSLALAPKVRVPTLVLHGDRDEVIPFALGQRLAGAIAGAEFVPLARAGHNDVWDAPGAKERVLDFLGAAGR